MGLWDTKARLEPSSMFAHETISFAVALDRG